MNGKFKEPRIAKIILKVEKFTLLNFKTGIKVQQSKQCNIGQNIDDWLMVQNTSSQYTPSVWSNDLVPKDQTNSIGSNVFQPMV